MANGEVSFRNFAALAKRKGWKPEFLAVQFRGKVDSPSEFFHRVLGGEHGNVVIPFHTVLDFYHQEQSPLIQDEAVMCACGCRKPVSGRQRYSSGSCRLRAYRERSLTARTGF